MSNLQDIIERETKFAGFNRLGVLLFTLSGKQNFAINVFKIKEVIQTPSLTPVPKSHPSVLGLLRLRESTVPVVDLSSAIGQYEPNNGNHIIVAEFNDITLGLQVNAVSRIAHLSWKDVHPPPENAGDNNYLTAITNIDNEIVGIIDVERILSETIQLDLNDNISSGKSANKANIENIHIIAADDSVIAQKQLATLLDNIGLKHTIVNNGALALDKIKEIAETHHPIEDYIPLLISDIEMPEMDGYTLTKTIKSDPQLAKITVILFTSISGIVHSSLMENVGADAIISKQYPEELVAKLKEVLNY